jgi:hypothetical protein
MPEELIGEYMRAQITPPVKGMKTRIYILYEKSSGAILGGLRWFGAWRGYCFFPNENAVFDGGCLTQLKEWLNDLNATHKEMYKRIVQ